MHEFKYSEKFLQKNNRLSLLIFLFAFCGIIIVLIFSGFHVTQIIVPIGQIILVMGATWIITALLMNRSFRKMRVLIDEDGLIKKSGKRQQHIPWDQIEKVFRRKNVKSEIEYLRIYKSQKRAIFLYGFSQMETIDSFIKQKISSDVPVITKKFTIDWWNPLPYIFVILLFVVFMIVIEKYLGPKAFDFLGIALCLGGGPWLLIYKPFSQIILQFKFLDYILGGFLFLAGIFEFVASFIL